MKNCNFNREDILAYCYGEFDSDKEGRFTAHLSSCEHCLSKVEVYKNMLDLIKQQKLKNVPKEMLDSYTQQIRSRFIRPGAEWGLVLQAKINQILDNISLAFAPRFKPAVAVVCVLLIVIFAAQYNSSAPIRLINQDIAMLEELEEDTGIALLTDDAEQLFLALNDSDLMLFAQAEEEIELEEILDELGILEELDEEDIAVEDLLEYLEILNELEIEPLVG